ncbi:peptide chain release factor N(5)-glutamine methyltransferase [Dysgonomonas sp. 520]|uniref:peptide chain release factor N(5)-glutamine methyltransferase n=1 Tax=Dysgonomonas sp. 520 TaxID=2302931 RepID=UPI0013D0AD6B|nr:peptide chain release factor N(5)-glutamine methyltransferase [Dysgonomonas sp. 520]NDW08785.1 peptide chain release factor N(5)-glutamine methyltransferase [Dysgonomonas sp. 520]
MTNTINYIKKTLSEFYPESEINGVTRIVIEDILNIPYHAILSDKNRKITSEEFTKIEDILSRLKKSEPIQYILGRTEFCGLPFVVNQNVLIPRPETEELVEIIIRQNNAENLSILDIGTGSGCIAVSLAKLMSEANISAWDVSEDALIVAKENAKMNTVNVNFNRVDVLGDYPTDKKFDIIVSNPPYVLESDKSGMDKNVLDHEPHLALFVPDDKALMFYERIADVAKKLLNPSGKLYFEIHYLKGQETMDMLKEKGFSDVTLSKDLSGNDRMVHASLIQ